MRENGVDIFGRMRSLSLPKSITIQPMSRECAAREGSAEAVALYEETGAEGTSARCKR